MKKLSMSELNRLEIEEYKSVKKIPVYLVLDNIRSMNNVGSIFRTCDAYRVKEIVLCGITPCPPHREIEKTALGATESVLWKHYENVKEAISFYRHKSLTIIGIEQTDKSVHIDRYNVDTTQGYVLLFGNEVNGLSESILDLIDFSIEIPQFGTKHSLNVSVAAGIAIHCFSIPFLRKMEKQ